MSDWPHATSLSGTVAWVTGASGGIGAALMVALASRGALVAGTARRSEPLAEACAAAGSAQVVPGLPRGSASEAGVGARPALPVPADITRPDEVGRALGAVVKTYGRLDILVNAAGVLRRGDVEDLSAEDWRESLAVNLTGPFLCAQAAVRQMLAQEPAAGGLRGHIVNIVSGAGVKPWVGASAYTAAKFGLMGFSEALREEVRFRGIRVSVVLPGPVETGMTALPDMADWKKLDPGEVAAAIVAALEAPAHVAVNRIDVRHMQAR